MATLLTVLRGGGRYDALWVERLARGARRHAPAFTRILCLTDMALDVEGVETVPLRHDWPAWWSKMEAFRPGLTIGTTVLCDLDTVFAGNADALAEPGLAAMEDYFLKGRVSTALLRWNGDELSHLYETFAGEPERWMAPGSCGKVPNSVHGDQVVVDHLLRRENRMPAFLQARHPGLLDFYDPDKARPGPVVIFIGDSKPDNARGPVTALWRGDAVPA
ncbi:hypothetical protein [Aureimonas sp. ME7]|uniref:hypothetical protein n=1 Tax=Aureimonas sp. ME7 TaxID=2744252 RepID=UPI0015F48DC7|nr:hypothetical protein [Aureimonas sp. ME7]